MVRRRREPVRAAGSIVAVHPLHPLVPLLRLDRHGGDRPSLEPLDSDGFVGLLTVAVGADLDPHQRLIDLGDQLASPVAGPQFQRAVGLNAGAVGDIGLVNAALRQACQGAVRLSQQVSPPAE